MRTPQPRRDEIALIQGNIKGSIRVCSAQTGLSQRLPNAVSCSRVCVARRLSKYSPQGRSQVPITICGSVAIGSKEASTPKVIVTREFGKNGKLITELSKLGIESIELPLIEHAHGEDRSQLPRSLREENWEWIVVTSPEAAAVFLEGTAPFVCTTFAHLRIWRGFHHLP
ncbi:hypothetical protein CYMTET_43579 [Cymbomonas tetramitiformis]|uniref:Uroporphyrinogen-III synthase n=1 Tax=Cymbomonas tetramitiformis TaxID=36881 RepID=A0AAE0F055_9CHLO|nr:hypothetical protein CYMTET_43579 [Cymbomonas tetramitiformis]